LFVRGSGEPYRFAQPCGGSESRRCPRGIALCNGEFGEAFQCLGRGIRVRQITGNPEAFNDACRGGLQVAVPALGTAHVTERLTGEDTVAHLARKPQRLRGQRSGPLTIASRAYDDAEVAKDHCEKVSIGQGACERRALLEERFGIRVLASRHCDECQVGQRVCRPSLITELAAQRESFPKQWLCPVRVAL